MDMGLDQTSWRDASPVELLTTDNGPCDDGPGDDGRAAEERNELHFLAALCDELMRSLLAAGVLNRAQLNEVEAAVAKRVGHSPRGW